MESLGEALPEEQARCRELLVNYREIGPAGAFGAALIEAALREADQAVIEGDLVAMIRVYQHLTKFE
jgi:hypothetical protein